VNALAVPRQMRRALRLLDDCPTPAERERRRPELRAIIDQFRAPVTLPPLLPEPASLVGGLRVGGYAAVFGADSKGNRRARGDFADSLPAYLARPCLTWGHRAAYPLGRCRQVYEDSFGLWVEADIFPAAGGDTRAELIEAVRCGAVRGLSYSAIQDGPTGPVALLEVAITASPGHPAARVWRVLPL